MQAIWNGAIIAESSETVVVEGNHYFPLDSVKEEYLSKSPTTSVCGWKGLANYYSLVVDGKTNPDACWYYADPKPEAVSIRSRVAFWKGVQVQG